MGRRGCHDPEVGKQVLVIHNKQFKNNEKVKRYSYLDYMMSPMMATKASVLPSEPHPLRGLELLLVSLPGLRLRLLLRLELRWRLTSPSLASCRCDSAGRRSACRMSLVCVCEFRTRIFPVRQVGSSHEILNKLSFVAFCNN